MSAPVLILALDRDHCVRFLNRPETEIDAERLIGQRIEDRIPEEYQASVHEAIDRVFETGAPAAYEVPIVNQSGELTWYSGRLGPIIDGGEVTAVSAIAIDVTEKKLAEQQRDRAQALLEAAIECLPFDFFALNPEGRYILHNATFREHYGDAVGRRPEDIAPNAEALSLWQDNNRRAFAGEVVEGEVEVTLNDGRHHFKNIITPICKGDESYGILGVNVDITGRVQAENEVRHYQRLLEELVEHRTGELEAANRQLKEEVEVRRQAEKGLKIFRQFVESAGQGFAMSDLDTKIRYINPYGLRFFSEFKLEHLVGQSFLQYFPASEQARLHNEVYPALAAVGHWSGEMGFVTPSGERRAAIFNSFIIRDDDGTPLCVATVATDITERQQIEEALRRSEERYRTLVEACPDAVFKTDLDARILFASQQTARVFGFDQAEDLLGRNVMELVCEGERQRILENRLKLLEQKVCRNREYRFLRKNGSEFAGELSAAVSHDAAGNPRALIAMLRDVTERKQAQEALHREQQTLRYMLRSSDHERRLIAYEIHDGLAQQLAAAIMQLQTHEYLHELDPANAKRAYEVGVELVRQAHAEARRLISGVRPPILDESGVVAGLAHLVHDQRETTGRTIEFHAEVSFDRLASVLENALFRIAQEALTNAIKHSGSKKVRLSLVQEEDRVRLEVRDWGTGFDPAKIDEDRFGLEGIRERTRLLGGDFAIESQVGEGTGVRVILPVLEED